MATITDINQLDLNGTYTYADYLLWKFEERIELIKGKIFKMSPAPSTKHQRILGDLHLVLAPYFKRQKCQIFLAPFDVRLPKKGKNNEQILTVVQPDLCVVCDPEKIDEKGCIGAPDLIVEIISPGNSKKEMRNKFQLYEEVGVQEYWIIHPSEEHILVNVLEDGKYRTLRPIVDDYITSVKFPELKIHTSDIF